MTGLTIAQLPPRDIRPSKILKRVLSIYVPIFVVTAVIMLAVSRNSAVIEGALMAGGALAVILGIEAPLILRAQRRRQAKMLSQVGPGAFFAGKVSMHPFGGRRGLPTTGRLVLSETGAWFEPKRPGGQGFALPWGEVGQIRLGPMPGKIGVGRLVLQLRTGDTRAFSVGNYGTLAKTLAEHP